MFSVVLTTIGVVTLAVLITRFVLVSLSLGRRPLFLIDSKISF